MMKPGDSLKLLQETIGRGHLVSGLEVSTNWMEIHDRIDMDRTEQELEVIQSVPDQLGSAEPTHGPH